MTVDPAMSEPGLDVSYPVLVTERNGRYTLRVKELALITRSNDLAQAYRDIVEKKRQIYLWAAKNDSLEEVPEPRAREITLRLLPGHVVLEPRCGLREASAESGAEGSL